MVAAGDVVRLKSGGPSMIVTEADGTLANVTWFDAVGHIQSATLGIVLLETVDPSTFDRKIDYPNRGHT
jgi:uncharacterized protein YodC (DUF2158 family)